MWYNSPEDARIVRDARGVSTIGESDRLMRIVRTGESAE